MNWHSDWRIAYLRAKLRWERRENGGCVNWVIRNFWKSNTMNKLVCDIRRNYWNLKRGKNEKHGFIVIRWSCLVPRSQPQPEPQVYCANVWDYSTQHLLSFGFNRCFILYVSLTLSADITNMNWFLRNSNSQQSRSTSERSSTSALKEDY